MTIQAIHTAGMVTVDDGFEPLRPSGESSSSSVPTTWAVDYHRPGISEKRTYAPRILLFIVADPDAYRSVYSRQSRALR
jgi:hypothetical protein